MPTVTPKFESKIKCWNKLEKVGAIVQLSSYPEVWKFNLKKQVEEDWFNLKKTSCQKIVQIEEKNKKLKFNLKKKVGKDWFNLKKKLLKDCSNWRKK